MVVTSWKMDDRPKPIGCVSPNEHTQKYTYDSSTWATLAVWDSFDWYHNVLVQNPETPESSQTLNLPVM